MEFQPPHIVNIEKDKRLPFGDIIDIIRAEIQGHLSIPSSKCYISITNPITECNLDFVSLSISGYFNGRNLFPLHPP
jgi:hypothetical protein